MDSLGSQISKELLFASALSKANPSLRPCARHLTCVASSKIRKMRRPFCMIRKPATATLHYDYATVAQ
eukprot:1160909-Pelagomonas_calceolata.AAC.12